MVLLIGYISTLFVQRLNHRKNMTKLRTVQVATIKGGKDIYTGYSNQTQYIILTISGSVKGQIINIVGHFHEVQEKYKLPKNSKVYFKILMRLIPKVCYVL